MTTFVGNVQYKATAIDRDGRCDFYEPSVPRRTGLLAIHGGSWSYGSKTDMYGLAQFYAAQGYTVGACNYHLQADGADPGSHLPQSYEDVRDFILFAQGEYPEVEYWYVIGHSAGGQLCFAVHARAGAPIDGVISLDQPGWDMPAMGDIYLDIYLRPYFTDPQLSTESCNVIMRANGGTTQSDTLAFIAGSEIEGTNQAQAQEYVDSHNGGAGGEVVMTDYEHIDLLYRAYETGNAVSNRIISFLTEPQMTLTPVTFIVTPNATDGTQRLSDSDGSEVPPVVLDPVSNISVTDNTETTQTISWGYGGTNNTGFEVEQFIDGQDSSWRIADTLGASARNYQATGLPEGTLIRHRVRAIATDSASTWAEVEQTTDDSAVSPPPGGGNTILENLTYNNNFEQYSDGETLEYKDGLRTCDNATCDTSMAYPGGTRCLHTWIAAGNEGSTDWGKWGFRIEFQNNNVIPKLEEGAEIWWRMAVYYPAGFNFATGVYGLKSTRFRRVRKSDENNLGYIDEYIRESGELTSNVEGDNADQSWYDHGDGINRGQWVMIEKYVKFSRNSPNQKLWKNGVKIGDWDHQVIGIGDPAVRMTELLWHTIWNNGARYDQEHWADQMAVAVRGPTASGNYDDTGSMDIDADGFPFIGMKV